MQDDISLYKNGPKKIKTYDQVKDLCEPTTLEIDISLLNTTLNSIYDTVGYSPFEWKESRRNQATISLTHPAQIPKKYITQYGEFIGKFRIAGSENELNNMMNCSYQYPMSEEDQIKEAKLEFWKKNRDSLMVIDSFNKNKWSEF